MKSIERPHSGTHQNYSAAPKVGRLDELKDWDFSTVIAEAQDLKRVGEGWRNNGLVGRKVVDHIPIDTVCFCI